VRAIPIFLALVGCSNEQALVEVDPGPPVRDTPIELRCSDPLVSGVMHNFPHDTTRQGVAAAWMCGRINVPIDPSEPDGPTLSMGFVRLPAGNPAKRRGVLFTNPGGPGASGVEGAFMKAVFLPDEVLDHYDIVGFDPRGVNWSGGEICTQGYPGPDVRPESQEELENFDDAMGPTVEACATDDPARHELGTLRVVEDMDALRAYFGEEKISYLGVSYGTRLGAAYAHAHPDRVDRFVLDAAVAQTDLFERLTDRVHARGQRMSELIATCEGCSSTFLEDLTAVAREVDEEPIVADVLTLDEATFDILVAEGLSNPPFFADVLPALAERDWSSIIDGITPYEAETQSKLLAYPSLSSEWSDEHTKLSVNCTDGSAVPTPEQVIAESLSLEEAYPYLESPVYSALRCPYLVTPEQLEPLPVPTAEGAPPIVVIGGTNDMITPYEAAVEMAERLASGVLVTSEHPGHGVSFFYDGSSCVDELLTEFLVDGVVPDDGTVCPAD